MRIYWHSERLASIREQADGDERRLRVLQEQVEATRERHSRAQAEALLMEEKIHSHSSQLEAIDAEAKAARRRAEEDRIRLATDEARQAQVQAELRELMSDRRQTLRELGDLGARRGHAEAELVSLIERAEALSQAHEEALSDIQEAERDFERDWQKNLLLKHCLTTHQHSMDLVQCSNVLKMPVLLVTLLRFWIELSKEDCR